LKYLVTGGAGRLGTAISSLLVRAGEEVRVFDLPGVSWDAISMINGVDIYKGDVTDEEVVLDAVQGVDAIIHLAAILPPNSEVSKKRTFRVNVDGTKNLVEATKTQPIIFASSISTYGITNSEKPPLMEEHPQQGHNNYSESKIEAERLIIASGVCYVILRVAPIAVAGLLELPDVVPYKADQRVEFIDFEDTALAFYQASLRSEARNKILNVAGGKSWQMTGSKFIDGFYAALGLEVKPTYSKIYTAVDWYDTSKSCFLGYQKTNFNDFQRKLGLVAEELDLI
jgi:nucleoside-diphosphate-sugar epimerase